MTPIRKLRDAGVNICLGSNNIRNAFTPYGNGDLIQIAMLAVPVAHLGGADDLPTVLPMITTNTAKALNIKDYGIAVGNRADLILLDTQRKADVLIDIPERLMVIKMAASRWKSKRSDDPPLSDFSPLWWLSQKVNQGKNTSVKGSLTAFDGCFCIGATRSKGMRFDFLKPTVGRFRFNEPS